jgi:hypothetical protein
MKHLLTTMWDIEFMQKKIWRYKPFYCNQWSWWCLSPLQEMSLKIDLFVFHKSYNNMFPYVPLSPFSPPMLSIIYLWSNFEGCLFVLFVALRSTKHTLTPFVTLFITLESLGWVGLHQVGFIIFQPIMEKLLNIEQFFSLKIYLNKNSKLQGNIILGALLILLESL